MNEQPTAEQMQDMLAAERERIARFLEDALGVRWASEVEMRPSEAADLVRRIRTGDYPR